MSWQRTPCPASTTGPEGELVFCTLAEGHIPVKGHKEGAWPHAPSTLLVKSPSRWVRPKEKNG